MAGPVVTSSANGGPRQGPRQSSGSGPRAGEVRHTGGCGAAERIRAHACPSSDTTSAWKTAREACEPNSGTPRPWPHCLRHWPASRTRVPELAVAPHHCWRSWRPALTTRRPKEQVLESLWPSQSPAGAANSLHQTLFYLRRDIDPWFNEAHSVHYLVVEPDLVFFDRDLVQVDSSAFLRQAAATLLSEAMHRCMGPALLRDYAGHLCSGVRVRGLVDGVARSCPCHLPAPRSEDERRTP